MKNYHLEVHVFRISILAKAGPGHNRNFYTMLCLKSSNSVWHALSEAKGVVDMA